MYTTHEGVEEGREAEAHTLSPAAGIVISLCMQLCRGVRSEGGSRQARWICLIHLFLVFELTLVLMFGKAASKLRSRVGSDRCCAVLKCLLIVRLFGGSDHATGNAALENKVDLSG
jgi:hypothetical protein